MIKTVTIRGLFIFLLVFLVSAFMVSAQCGGTGVVGDEACEVCGDGVVSGDEICDDQIRQCSTLDDSLIGSSNCKSTCDGWDMTTCEEKDENGGVSECGTTGVAGDEACEVCGNGVINGDEICDGGTKTCSFFDGSWSGTSSCNSKCDGWDLTSCITASGEPPYNPSQGCVDTDGGDNLFVKGTCYYPQNHQGLTDRCDGDRVEDFSCSDDICVGNGHVNYPCLNGCSDGVCLPFISEEETVETTNEKEVIILEQPVAECLGCRLNQKTCLPIGTRLQLDEKSQFCDLDNQIKQQKAEENSCNNNFECSSNVCVNNECISKSLIQKVIEWFKSLFGG